MLGWGGCSGAVATGQPEERRHQAGVSESGQVQQKMRDLGRVLAPSGWA